MSSKKRAREVHYLDLKETESLPSETKLPIARENLCMFLHHHLSKGVPELAAASRVLQEIKESYEWARVLVQGDSNIILKIITLYKNYKNLKKNKERESESELKREQEFVKRLESLFIVVTKDWKKSSLPEDRRFYENQLNPGKLNSKTIAKNRMIMIFFQSMVFCF